MIEYRENRSSRIIGIHHMIILRYDVGDTKCIWLSGTSVGVPAAARESVTW